LNGTETTTVTTASTSKLKAQTVIPKASESRTSIGKAALAPFVRKKRQSVYTLRSVESIKANAYADWLRNQMR